MEAGGKSLKTIVAKSAKQIYQIKVTLKYAKPPIWRRLLVSSDTTLADLHDIIQIAMGWTDSHLHHFEIEGRYYRAHKPGFDLDLEVADAHRLKLDKVVRGEGFKFEYVYDFGDNWEHVILVEKILPFDPTQKLPVCVKGRRACPPEDVGGVWGYKEFLEAIANPEHPSHDSYAEWIEGVFDAEAFDLEDINRQLAGLR
ncbi:MAG: plasmid pRiA4b ORF-3 family protein [Aggregatilineales bacterium]